jgi:hypothetical protein
VEITRVSDEEAAPHRPKRRSLWLLAGIAVVGVGMAVFRRRQNKKTQLGGAISLPKVLWLNYALDAWFLVPFAFWRARAVSPELRRIYQAHLALFAARGGAEMWLLYGVHRWIPPYGIAHDALVITTITYLLRLMPSSAHDASDEDRAARDFLTSIRVALLVEILFAALFYFAVAGGTHGRDGVWFASDDPRFRGINALTWLAVTVGYADLIRTGWVGKDALFPRLSFTEERA